MRSKLPVIYLKRRVRRAKGVAEVPKRGPSDPQPAWWGYSIGRWESDAFVVETSGFRDMAWLDFNGHPATDAMRITERYRRTNVGEMDVQFTFDDSKAYTRPWSVTVSFILMPDTEFLEHVCENEYTYQRLTTQ